MGIYIVYFLCKRYNWSFHYSLYLFFFKFLFFLVYLYFEISNYDYSDFNYFFKGEPELPTEIMTPGNSFFGQSIILLRYLGMDYVSVSSLLNLLGTIAFVIYGNLIVSSFHFSEYKMKLTFLFVPFVSLSSIFFSSTPSKDTLCFFSISLIFLILMKKEKIFLLIFPFIFLTLTRPHFAVIFLFSVFVSFVIKNYKNNIKYFFSCVVGGIFIYSISFLVFTHYNFESGAKKFLFFNFVEHLYDNLLIAQNNYQETSLAIPNDIFILFRPLYYLFGISVKEGGLFYFIYIFENFILATILLIKFINIDYKKIFKKGIKYKNLILCLFVIILLYFLSITTGNYGIVMRQKSMILFPLIVIICQFKNKISKIKKKVFNS